LIYAYLTLTLFQLFLLKRLLKNKVQSFLYSYFFLDEKVSKKSRTPNACLTAVRLQRALPDFKKLHQKRVNLTDVRQASFGNF
jgi:hypothetical protein